AGGNGQGENLNQLSYPQGVIVDDLGQIYMADCWNDRIMRWCEGEEEGEIVVGGHRRGNQLNRPMGLCFDDEENLYVVDYLNHRIQKFEIILKIQKLEPEDEASVDPRSDRTRGMILMIGEIANFLKKTGDIASNLGTESHYPKSTTTAAKKRKRFDEDGDETRSKSNILNVNIECRWYTA
ncbi:unnamed protein product, partial [Adineta steineri]